MSDTLVENDPPEKSPDEQGDHTAPLEPPPPTVPDPTASPAPPSRARGCVVAAAIAATLIGAAAVFVYFYLWRYEPRARQHVPDGAVVAVRLEAANVVLFGPVRKHLWPLVNPSSNSVKPAPEQKPKPSRVVRIAELTGVHLARDVREVVFAVTDPNSWVVLVGGNLDRGRFVKGIATLFKEEGTEGWSEVGEMLVGPGGMTIGQADDGTIVLGSNQDVARAALPATDSYEDLELPEQGAVVFAVTQRAWKGIGATLPPGTPRADVLGRVRHGSGRLILGDAPSIELRVQSGAEQDAAAMAADIEGLLATLRLALLLAPDRWGEKEALSATTVTPEAWSVVLRAPWPIAGLDRACEQLAGAIRSGHALPPDPSSRLGARGAWRLALIAALLVARRADAQPSILRDRPCPGCLVQPSTSSEPAPLLVVLHGDGQAPAKMVAAWGALAARRGWSLFAPRCPAALGCNGSWWRWDGEPRWLDEQIARLDELRIDADRTFLVGWSGGASWIGYRWADLSDRWAAVVIHGGGRPPAASSCPPRSPPVYFLVGDRNPLHHLAVELREALRSCRSESTWDSLSGADYAAEQRGLAARGGAVLDWLRAHPREAPPDPEPMPSAPAVPPAASAEPRPALPALPPRSGCGCSARETDDARVGVVVALSGLCLIVARRRRSAARRREQLP